MRQGCAQFSLESMPLRPRSEGALSLYNVSEATGMRHEHGVDVSLVEEWRWCGDGRWDLDFGCLADLALVARLL